MSRKVQAIAGGKITLQDELEEIFKCRITPYGNGTKIDAKKTYWKKRLCDSTQKLKNSLLLSHTLKLSTHFYISTYGEGIMRIVSYVIIATFMVVVSGCTSKIEFEKNDILPK